MVVVVMPDGCCCNCGGFDYDFFKGHPPSADLIYGEEDSISPNTLVLADIKG